MVGLGLLIAVQKWEHSRAAMADRHRRAKSAPWMGASVDPGRADEVL